MIWFSVMAWRIDEFLIRGEIDNRERGRVTGALWFWGRDEPVVLDLLGDAWRDLAGRRLLFVNPTPKPASAAAHASLAARQHGQVGDITASRKVKVPDVPMDEVAAYYERREPFPWHWGNSLYLEWFTPAQGRVVIESASYQLVIDPESTWDMTPEEDDQQHVANAAALQDFVAREAAALLESEAREFAEEGDDDDGGDDGFEPNRPMTEAEAETLQARSDQLNDRVIARLEREGLENADLEQIIAEELERARRERGEPPLSAAEREELRLRNAELFAAAEAALEDVAALEDDWDAFTTDVDEDDGNDDASAWTEDAVGDGNGHPLARRGFALSVRVMEGLREGNTFPTEGSAEHPVIELMASTSRAGAKLAGALNRTEWPPEIEDAALCIVWLKKVADHLADALMAAAACRSDQLLDGAWLAEIETEIRAITVETEALIRELRARLDDAGA